MHGYTLLNANLTEMKIQNKRNVLFGLLGWKYFRNFHRVCSAAISRLGSLDVRNRSYDLIPKMLVNSGRHFERLTDITCSDLPFGLCACTALAGSPWLTPAQFSSTRNSLKMVGIDGDARRACLYCLLHKGVCVIESEWHYVFFCPLFFSNLRNCPLARASAADDDAEFYILPCPRDRFLDLLTRCAQELVLAQSLGSYNRLSLRERGRWLSETVGETLLVDPACINAARVYCSSLDFE